MPRSGEDNRREKRDGPAGWTRRSCSMLLCESIESHERGGTDEMDVTRILDPLICPGAWNRGFTHSAESSGLYCNGSSGLSCRLQLDMQVRRRTRRLRVAACRESDVCYLLPLTPLFVLLLFLVRTLPLLRGRLRAESFQPSSCTLNLSSSPDPATQQSNVVAYARRYSCSTSTLD
jgi:hypothetical protein